MHIPLLQESSDKTATYELFFTTDHRKFITIFVFECNKVLMLFLAAPNFFVC
jgi:hypothetical protein